MGIVEIHQQIYFFAPTSFEQLGRGTEGEVDHLLTAVWRASSCLRRKTCIIIMLQYTATYHCQRDTTADLWLTRPPLALAVVNS